MSEYRLKIGDVERRDIIQVRWKTFICFCSKFIQETVDQSSSESPVFCKDITENMLVFSLDTLHAFTPTCPDLRYA